MRSSGEGDEWDNGSWKEKTSRIKDLIILEDENEGMTEENAKKFSSFLVCLIWYGFSWR